MARRYGDGALYQRGSDGLWVGSVDIPTADGKRRRAVVSSKSYAKAAAKLRKLRREVEDGTVAVSGNTTVEQWCTRWLDSIVKPRVKPKTFDYYESAVRLLIVPTIGRKRLSKLTPEDVRVMHRTIQATSTRNAVKAHQALQKALTDATREGLVARNVAELVDKPKHLTAEQGALTAHQARAIINAAVDSGDPLASRWAAAFYTGMRPGELLGLTWDRVDFGAGTLDVSWQLQQRPKVHGCGDQRPDGSWPCGRQRGAYCPSGRFDLPPGFDYRPLHGVYMLTSTKTKAGTRTVPLAGPVEAMLRAHYAATRGDDNPFGFVWHVGGHAVSPADERESWSAACVQAGLAQRSEDGKRWIRRPPAPYVSRHTAATLLQDAGVGEDIRMAIMGHSSVAAHRGYVHTNQGPKRLAIEALEAVLDVEDDGQ